MNIEILKESINKKKNEMFVLDKFNMSHINIADCEVEEISENGIDFHFKVYGK